MFWDKDCFINQLLISLCEVQADYTCCQDSSLIFSSEFYLKGISFPFRKSFFVVIIVFCWLLAIEET